MKTGFTGEAKYCLSGTAKRDGMHLIAVVLGAETSDKRFAAAKGLLDYGFANYSILTPELPDLEPINVTRGVEKSVSLKTDPINILTEKGGSGQTEAKLFVNESLRAPVQEGAEAGYVAYYRNGSEIGRAPIYTAASVDEVSYSSLLSKLFKALFYKG
jgi:D-alanyl-D-alanine carboxypeptidase (penicillin-binding protein 5/6)